MGTFAIQLAKHLGATVATTTSANNVELVKSLGADVVIDYKTQDFEKVLSGYDLVLQQPGRQDARKIPARVEAGWRRSSRSRVRPIPNSPGRQGLNLFLKLVMRLLSRGARKQAKSLGVRYLVPVHACQGQQLSEITSLIESGVIRPVVDQVFPFEKTNDALAYVETGRAKGKVVVAVKQEVP